jgi:hypothetical protein
MGRMRLLAAVLFLAAPVFGQSSCSYSVTPTTLNIGSQTFTGSIAVEVLTGGFCSAWSAKVDPGVSWLHITSGAASNGDGTVEFTADANPAGISRSGTMTVALTSVLVIQSANACIFSVSAAAPSFPVNGGIGTVSVTANCTWRAIANDASWIAVPTPPATPMPR